MTFNAKEMGFIKILQGKQLEDIFLQPVAGLISDVDMFVLNFGDNHEVSIHAFCFLRATRESEILLTSTDFHFGENYEWLTYEEQEETRHNCFLKTLLERNRLKLKTILKDSFVSNAYFTEVGDIIIEFTNSVIIELRVDALYDDFECYRIIVGNDENTNKHHVVVCQKDKLVYSIE